MRSNILLALFLSLCLVCSQGRKLVVIPPGEATIQDLHSQELDIRGEFEGYVVLVADEDDQATISSLSSEAILSAEYDESGATTYAVLERQILENNNNIPTYFVTLPHSALHLANVSALLHPHRILVSIPTLHYEQLTQLLPYDWEITSLPSSSIHVGIRSSLAGKVKDIYAKAMQRVVVPDPDIEALIARVNGNNLKVIATYLTGEDGISGLHSRNSLSQGALDAAKWIEAQFAGYGLTASQETFRSGYCPNVIGILPGLINPELIVVVGAHYDSRGSSSTDPNQRAPGANDNGSGTSAVIQFAKAIYEAKAQFAFTIHFIAFGGEEQGLYGSAAYAQKLASQGAEVIAMLNSDMIAYHVPTEQLQCAFPNRYVSTELTTLARAVVAEYVPSLVIGTTTACCSDHQSFNANGFPATGFFERNGPIADPMYHNSADLVNRVGYDLDQQYPMIAKGVLATIATIAELISPVQ